MLLLLLICRADSLRAISVGTARISIGKGKEGVTVGVGQEIDSQKRLYEEAVRKGYVTPGLPLLGVKKKQVFAPSPVYEPLVSWLHTLQVWHCHLWYSMPHLSYSDEQWLMAGVAGYCLYKGCRRRQQQAIRETDIEEQRSLVT